MKLTFPKILITEVTQTQMGNGYDSTKRKGLRQDMFYLLHKSFRCIDFENLMFEM